MGLSPAHDDPGAPTPLRVTARDLGLVDKIIERMRGLSRGLWPSELDDLGLVPALRSLIRGLEVQAGTDLSFRVGDGPPVPRDRDTETACYHVAKGALSNALRHAGAAHVRVTLRWQGGGQRLTVNDDGSGFDPTTVVARYGEGWNLGLSGMRERTTLAGGRFGVRSIRGTGTGVRAAFPIGRATDPGG